MSRLMSLFMAGSAIWAGSVASAYAAEAAAPGPASADVAGDNVVDGLEQEKPSDIVVTGTLIRGIAPAGTETITVTQEDIKETGAVTTNDFLAKIPQVSFFNRPSNQGNNGAGIGRAQGIDQPQIHGLPTLILLDGHRVAAAGAGGGGAATSIDPSIIPTGVLGGIEIVPDGGSALYGSDAVGGVLNFTTLKRFNGVKLDGAIGFADDYMSYRANVTAGKDWGSGSIFISYSYLKTDALTGADRPYIDQFPKIQTCFPATVAAGGVQYTYNTVDANGRPTAYVTGPNTCSRYANETILPAQQQNSVFAGLSQDLNSAFHVDLRAFYSTRKTASLNTSTIVLATRTIPTANPFYTKTPQELAGLATSQTASFSLFPAVGSLPMTTKLDTWGVNGELKADVGGGFQVRLGANYSQSQFNDKVYNSADTTLLATALARTGADALDPYNPAATPGSILVANQIANRPTYDFGRTQETQVRLVTDGTLFHIPGGDVKVAAGGELLHDDFASRSWSENYLGTVVAGSASRLNASRTVYSAFGELEVPLISPESHGPIYELRLSAAGRYDHYSDFGGTFNPRFAVSAKPVEWLTFRGTYGHSFVAPSLPTMFAPMALNYSNTAFILPTGALNALIVTGGNPNLKPQKATTWTLGLDLKVPFVEGLRASMTYYNVRFRDKLGNPPFTDKANFFTSTYAAFYMQNPTYDQALAFIGAGNPGILTDGRPLTALYPGPNNGRVVVGTPATSLTDSPYYIESGRTENFASENDEGIDFDVTYKRPMSFGSLDFEVAGTFILKSETSVGLGYTDLLATTPGFKGFASVGANVGNFRFSTTLYHTSGYGLLPNTTGQLYVEPYNTVDAFLSYTFKDEGYLKDTVLSLNVKNLFDVRPPVQLNASTSYGPGDIIGRFVQLGLTKKF